MHIVHCLTHSIHGGGQAVPYLLIKNLLQFYPEIRHTVILPPNGIYVERFKKLGIQVVEFPFNKVRFSNFARIKVVLQSLSPDIVHTHGRGAGLYVRSISKKYLRAARIHTHHGFHIPYNFPNNILFKISEDYFLRRTDTVISVSESEAEIIYKTNPKSMGKTKVITNIVHKDEVVNNSKADKLEFTSIIQNMIDKFVVIMIGRDDPIKNYPLAFLAAKKVLEINKSVFFLFIGVELQNKFLTTLQANNPDNIAAIPSVANPLPLLSQSSILLLTSKREAGAPLVMMEAACLGVPVLGVRVRGLYDSIHDGKNGICVDNDANAIKEALLRCVRDKELIGRLSKGALLSSQEFDLQKWCRQYYAIYTGTR